MVRPKGRCFQPAERRRTQAAAAAKWQPTASSFRSSIGTSPAKHVTRTRGNSGSCLCRRSQAEDAGAESRATNRPIYPQILLKTLQLSLPTLDADIAEALAEYKGLIGLGEEVIENLAADHPLSPRTAMVYANLFNGVLPFLTAFESPDSVEVAKSLAARPGG